MPTPKIAMAVWRPAFALLVLLAIFSGADAKKTKKLSASEREERRAKGELLMNAVNLGDREEVERLIEEEDAGKCVNHDAGGGKGAPLRNAAKMGYTRIVDILLQAGADARLCMADGDTAHVLPRRRAAPSACAPSRSI